MLASDLLCLVEVLIELLDLCFIPGFGLMDLFKFGIQFLVLIFLSYEILFELCNCCL